MGKELKDDISKETTVTGHTHGPLGMQRLPDLTKCESGLTKCETSIFIARWSEGLQATTVRTD